MTEQQRNENLTIRREKERARRRTKKLQEEKKQTSETEDHEKQRMATLKRLGKVMKMVWREIYDWRRWSLAKSSGWLWRQKEEQDWRMMQLPNGSGCLGDGRRKKSKTGKYGSYHTAQIVPGNRGRQKRKKMDWIGFGFDLDLIWIEIGVFKNKKNYKE